MDILFFIINGILDSVTVALYFIGLFGSNNRRGPVILHIGAYAAMQFLLSAEPYVINFSSGFYNQVALTIWATLLTFLITLLYKSTLRNRLFVAISFEALALLAENIVYITIPASQKYSTIAQSENMETIFTCFAKLLALCFVLIIVHIVKRHKLAYSIKYSILVMVIPVLSPIMLFFVIDLVDIKFAGMYIYQLFTILSLFVINVVNFLLFDYVLLSKKLSTENKQLVQQETFQETKYIQLSTAYRNTRSIVHDTKKHLFIIQNYLDSLDNDRNEYDSKASELREYLSDAIKDLDNTVSQINTGILVIDAFLNNYISLTAEDNITLKLNLKVDKNLISINEYDLCVILGNLLDNSYESCKKQSAPKDISVNITTERGNLIIYISNSLPPGKSNFYTRSENLHHGYGLKNVERITSRYYGTFTTFIEKDRYEAVVTIPYNLENSKVH